MASGDLLTDINWPSSFYSSDESTVDSTQPTLHPESSIPQPNTRINNVTNLTRTTNVTPNPHPHNPYHTTPTAIAASNGHNTATATTPPHHTWNACPKQPSIHRWFNPQNRPIRHTDPAPLNPTPQQQRLPLVKLKQVRRKRSQIQLPLHELLHNNHWGDIPSKDPARFRVISKNVNSLSTTDNNLQWRGAAQALQDLDAHILCIQESNTKWTTNITRAIYHIFQRTFMHAKLTTSASLDTTDSNHQPGGTFLAVVGCYASRILATGSDHSGLGRWSYSELTGRNGRRFIVTTAYRVGNQQPTLGSTTAYTQQYHLLLRQGVPNPNPRAAFITDLISFVTRWQSTHDILICMDANDTTIQSDDHGVDQLIEATSLIDLHQYRFPNRPSPATHHRGSKTIDYCLGTRGFAEALTGAWMLPFGLLATLTGDHRTLGLEFDHDVLFGQKFPRNELYTSRGIYSNAYPTVRKFNDEVAQECDRRGLIKAAQTLSNKYTFSPADHQELERIDQALTAVLVNTDKKFAKHKQSPWSPDLHQAFLTHCYWRTKLTQKRTNRDYTDVLTSIANKMTTPPATQGSLTHNLHEAQHTIWEIRRTAINKRKSYFQELAEAAQNSDDKSKWKLILQLRLDEQNRQCFATHQNFMKPRSAGGLMRLLIPKESNPSEWKR